MRNGQFTLLQRLIIHVSGSRLRLHRYSLRGVQLSLPQAPMTSHIRCYFQIPLPSAEYTKSRPVNSPAYRWQPVAQEHSPQHYGHHKVFPVPRCQVPLLSHTRARPRSIPAWPVRQFSVPMGSVSIDYIDITPEGSSRINRH